jgi:RNA polymerase sigma-70 factor (subfamily 1)
MPPTRDSAPSSVADLAALGKLWEQHRDRLLAMVERRIDPHLRQRVGPDAILQDAFLDASRRWPAYQAGSPMHPFAWLYQITYDRLIETHRRHAAPGRDARREQRWPDDCSAVLGGQLIDAGTGPLTAAQRAELAEHVHRVLHLLPDADRDLLTMRYFDQLSTREICDVLNARQPGTTPLTENVVNVRLFRALKKLQKLWHQLFGEPESRS